jgi:catechol 2,3-dioxygenase-like lactoylglutathione lyase family enzyme
MIDHISLQVDDVDTAMAWYSAFLAPLGIAAVADFGDVVGYGPAGGAPVFWIGKATDPGGRQTHVAFTAADRATVDAVHRVAVDLGREILHPPKEWPQYHPGYYAVFVRDPDGTTSRRSATPADSGPRPGHDRRVELVVATHRRVETGGRHEVAQLRGLGPARLDRQPAA